MDSAHDVADDAGDHEHDEQQARQHGDHRSGECWGRPAAGWREAIRGERLRRLQESEVAAMPYENYAANYPYGERAQFPRII